MGYFFFKIYFIVNDVYVCVCVYMYTRIQNLQRPKESIGSLGARVTDSFDLHMWVLGSKPGSSVRVVFVLNCRAISLAPMRVFLLLIFKNHLPSMARSFIVYNWLN